MWNLEFFCTGLPRQQLVADDCLAQCPIIPVCMIIKQTACFVKQICHTLQCTGDQQVRECSFDQVQGIVMLKSGLFACYCTAYKQQSVGPQKQNPASQYSMAACISQSLIHHMKQGAAEVRDVGLGATALQAPDENV